MWKYCEIVSETIEMNVCVRECKRMSGVRVCLCMRVGVDMCKGRETYTSRRRTII